MIFSEQELTETDYQALVRKTFGEYRAHVRHQIIVATDHDQVAAVINYFRYGVDTMYLHYCWFAQDYKSPRRRRDLWLEFFDYAKARRFARLMGVIDSRNKPALIWALKTGFNISGTRQSPDKNLIIDILKEL